MDNSFKLRLASREVAIEDIEIEISKSSNWKPVKT